MARIRSIKPEVFLHEELHDLEQETGLPIFKAFVGLWCHADREGRFVWRPRALKAGILPFDDVDFSRVLDALTTRGFLVKYASPTGTFGWIPGLKRHQVFNPRERASVLPDPNATDSTVGTSTRDPRVSDASSTRDDPCPSGREGKGREGTRHDASAQTPPASPPAPPEPERTEPVVEDLAPKLATALAEDPGTCAKALRELTTTGVGEDFIRHRVAAIDPTQRIGVWAWKATVVAGWRVDHPKTNTTSSGLRSPEPVHIQPDSNGATLARIAADKARAQADLDAFKASGYATRSEWLKARKSGAA